MMIEDDFLNEKKILIDGAYNGICQIGYFNTWSKRIYICFDNNKEHPKLGKAL